MKNLLKTTVLICTILLSVVSVFAQTQFEAIKTLGDGEYRIYDVQGKSGGYTFGFDPKASSTSTMFLHFKNVDDERKFYINLKWGNSSSYFTLDEVGHPATLVTGGQIHPKLNYTRRREGSERLVAIGEVVYYLKDYKGVDDFRLYKVLKKGKLSKMQAMKEYVKALKMNNEGHEQIIKDYLKKELAAQPAAVAKWKASNGDFYSKMEQDKVTWKKLLKESDAQRDKMLAEQRARKARNSGGSKSSTFTFKNNTGKILEVLGDNCCVKNLSQGSTATFRCDEKVHTVVMKGQSKERGSVICSGKNYCGKTFVYGSAR